jgi:hypothetical protein
LSEQRVSGPDFSRLHNTLGEFIRVNATVLAVAQWTESGAQPLFRLLVERTARNATEKYPWLRSGQELNSELDSVAVEYQRDAVAALNALTLVFAHTVTDAAIDELLGIAARALPLQWVGDEEKFNVTLKQLRDTSVDEFEQQAAKRLLQRQQDKSLPAKVQHLFRISKCGPSGFGIKLDIADLTEADRMRHQVVHAASFRVPDGRLFPMLSALQFAAEASIRSVARACGYSMRMGRNGFEYESDREEQEQPEHGSL